MPPDQPAPQAAVDKPAVRWLTRNLAVLSAVSLLQDAASELLYPIMPIFLTVALGAPAAAVGVVEGLAEGIAALTKVASTNPDTFYFTGYYPEAGTLAKEWKDLGLNSKFSYMAGSGEYDPAYITAGGPATDGTTITFPVGPDTATGTEFENFKTAYKTATGKDMATYAIYESLSWRYDVYAQSQDRNNNPLIYEGILRKTFDRIG